MLLTTRSFDNAHTVESSLSAAQAARLLKAIQTGHTQWLSVEVAHDGVSMPDVLLIESELRRLTRLEERGLRLLLNGMSVKETCDFLSLHEKSSGQVRRSSISKIIARALKRLAEPERLGALAAVCGDSAFHPAANVNSPAS